MTLATTVSSCRPPSLSGSWSAIESTVCKVASTRALWEQHVNNNDDDDEPLHLPSDGFAAMLWRTSPIIHVCQLSITKQNRSDKVFIKFIHAKGIVDKDAKKCELTTEEKT